jgi:ketosteroid isomerase-like protein
MDIGIHFMNFDLPGGPEQLRTHARDTALNSDAVVARFDWRFNAEFRADGSSLETEGRESQVWTATGDGWRLAHVHYSGMPVSAEREGF